MIACGSGQLWGVNSAQLPRQPVTWPMARCHPELGASAVAASSVDITGETPEPALSQPPASRGPRPWERSSVSFSSASASLWRWQRNYIHYSSWSLIKARGKVWKEHKNVIMFASTIWPHPRITKYFLKQDCSRYIIDNQQKQYRGKIVVFFSK